MENGTKKSEKTKRFIKTALDFMGDTRTEERSYSLTIF